MTTGDQTDSNLRSMFATIDRKDTAGFVEFLSADAVLRFGSSPPVSGGDAIFQAVDGFFASIHDLSHEIDFVARLDGRVICEGNVTYVRHDGSSIRMPFANIMELADESDDSRYRHYKVYADYAPLWAGGE